MKINYDVLENIHKLLKNHQSTDLLIVTKNRDKELVNELIKKGYRLFGENRVQEAKKKFINLSMDSVKIHLIGPLQTNKIKDALSLFDVIQSIDRYKLVDQLSKFILNMNSPKTKEYYIQINIGKESQKSGISIDECEQFYSYCKLAGLNIVGLMCIPPNTDKSKNYFQTMVSLRDSINKNLKLSMGMSNDYEDALSLGSNLIRVGSKIFN